MFPFYTRVPEYQRSEHGPEIDSGTSFFLVQILKILLYTWGDDWRRIIISEGKVDIAYQLVLLQVFSWLCNECLTE